MRKNITTNNTYQLTKASDLRFIPKSTYFEQTNIHVKIHPPRVTQITETESESESF